jgi:protocatechuate 3,4-dioxygenase beta subunit
MTRPEPPAYRPFPPGSQPPYAVASYGSTTRRAPHQPLITVPSPTAPTAPTAASATPPSMIEHAGPVFSPDQLAPHADLSRVDGRDALGERIIVAGRVTDDADRPVAHAMIELWQANAAGRYHHAADQHDAPLDPNFHGAGRVFTDADGRYRFVTIKPGAYPWRNHHNAWRPNHIHLSLFGASWGARLVTQMYFPGDPLLAIDPIYQSVPDAAARARLVAALDLELTQPEWALGYRFDVVLRGLHATPMEGGR